MIELHPAYRTVTVGDVWYRYEDRMYSTIIDADREEYGSELRVRRQSYWVVRVTPKGVWLSSKFGSGVCPGWPDPKSEEIRFAPRFVLVTAIKKFACPTDELARESFVKRKERQKSIYESKVKVAQKAIDIVQGTCFDWKYKLDLN